MKNQSSTIEDYFQRAETIGNLIAADLPYMVDQLEESTGDFEKYWSYLDLKEKLNSYCDSALGEDIIYHCYLLLHSSFPTSSLLPSYPDLFANSALRIHSSTNIGEDITLKDQEWFQTTAALNNSSYWFSHPDSKHIIWISRNLTGYFLTQPNEVKHYSLGTLLIGIDISQMTEHLNDNALLNNLNFFITDQEKRIIYSEDSALLNQNFNNLIEEQDIFTSRAAADLSITMNGTPYRLWKQTLPGDMYLLSIVPTQTFNNQIQENLHLFLLLFAVILLSGIVLTAIFSRIVTYPIRKLSTHMQSISAPTPISHNYEPTDEIGILYHTFNEMTEKHDELIQQIYDYTEQQKQLKYTLLQAQINPHFLYNTLDSVSCAALIHGENELSDILSSLATLLRYNINQPDQLVTLQDELDMINDYIAIQQFRCDNRIRFTCNVSPEMMITKLPKTILQPLIENSIQYGSLNADGYRYITINVSFSDAIPMPFSKTCSNILITICNESNNTENNLEASITTLNHYLNGGCELKRKNSGLGILNVQQRIHLVFGESYGIHYECLDNNILTVLNLPFFP